MITGLKNVLLDIKEKTQGMTASEKIGYFWEYYRVETAFIVFFLFMFLSIGGSIISNAMLKPALKVGVLTDVERVCSEDLDSLLQEAFPDATGRQAPARYGFSSPSDETNLYAAVQLAAYLSAEELECGICDEDSLSYIKETGRPLKVFNISNSALGQKMAPYGLTPLYYFYFEDTEHTDAAASFENYVCR